MAVLLELCVCVCICVQLQTKMNMSFEYALREEDVFYLKDSLEGKRKTTKTVSRITKARIRTDLLVNVIQTHFRPATLFGF